MQSVAEQQPESVSMSELPEKKPSPENPAAPHATASGHANIIAENLRRIDAALPLFPLSPSSDDPAGRHLKHDDTQHGPHQPSVRSPEDSGGR